MMIDVKSELKNRVGVCEFNNNYLFYDQNTGKVFLADSEEKCKAVLEEIENTKVVEPLFFESRDNSFKINLSTICNLHCDYCFRDKESHVHTDVQKAKEIIDYILDVYAPNLDFYSFAFNMTSESLFELEKLKEIKRYLDERINIKFTRFDVKSVKQGQDYLSYFGTELVPNLKEFDSVEKIINKLNSFLGLRNLIDYFLIPEGMIIPEWESNQLKNVKKLSKREVYLLNRRLIEVLFPESFNHKPNYSFYICTNGTIYTEEASKFFKEIDLKKICVSLDGPACVHDKHRYFYNGNASHSGVLKNIKKFMADGFDIEIACVITRDCLKPLKLATYFKNLGAVDVGMNVVRAGWSCSLASEDADELIEGYKELFGKLYLDVVKGDYSLVDVLKNDVCFAAVKHVLCKTKIVKRCKWNEEMIFDSKGDIYPCDYFIGRKEYIRGSIGSEMLKNPGDGKLMIDERENCKDCWCKYMCGGSCYYNSLVRTGDLAIPDFVECKINRAVRELGLKFVHKLILAGVNMFEFGKRIGISYDNNLVFDKQYILENGVKYSFRGTLTRFERECRKLFDFLDKSGMHYKKDVYVCVNNIEESGENKVLDVSLIAETREQIPYDAAVLSEYESLRNYDLGRNISVSVIAIDSEIEKAKKTIISTVQGYRIPVKGFFVYKGSLGSFLGTDKDKIDVIMPLYNDIY